MRSKTLLAAVVAAAISYAGTGLASANIISITPSKDNTLYEYDPADGDTSNALGFHLFAGKTAMGELRRGVLAFDIAGSIPAGSTITGVTLSMNMSRTPISVAYPVELHKLLADWGEGTSQAPGEEGDGAPATPNDATWRHRFFDTIFWAAQGGDFSPYRSLLATGAILFRRGDFKLKAGALDDKTRCLVGSQAEALFQGQSAAETRLPLRQTFPAGGYYILGCDFETDREIRLIADAGL